MTKCYIIGEIGLNHNGSLDMAKKLIDISKEAKIDAVKFQKRTISELAIKEYLSKSDSRFPSFGKTYKEIREFLEFDKEQYIKLKKYSEELDLDFIVTPFDEVAVDFLEEIDLKTYKLASHSVTNIDLLKKVAQLNKETIISTGMTEIDDIDTAKNIFDHYKNFKLKMLHCVSSYPTPLDQCNLDIINFLKNRYNIPVGYSGHEEGFLPSIVAVSMGAEIIERHITVDRNLEGFDHKLSLNPIELKEMTKQIREIQLIKGKSDKKISDVEKITKDKYHVSMVSKNQLKAGTVISKKDIKYKNPGIGIPPKEEFKVFGKVLKQNVPADVLINYEMFE